MALASVISKNDYDALDNEGKEMYYMSTLHGGDYLLIRSKMAINDPVNRPVGYTPHPSGVECIQITRHMSYNIGNAIKYLWRNGIKPDADTIQDLEKAAWYIQDEIKKLKAARESQPELGLSDPI